MTERQSLTRPIIPQKDCKSLLSNVSEATQDFEYVTPVMFSSLVGICVLSYLRGKGHKLDGSRKRKERMDILEQGIEDLVDYSFLNEDFGWFLDKLDRLQEAMGERGMLAR